jgi:hypothetical protein
MGKYYPLNSTKSHTSYTPHDERPQMATGNRILRWIGTLLLVGASGGICFLWVIFGGAALGGDWIAKAVKTTVAIQVACGVAAFCCLAAKRDGWAGFLALSGAPLAILVTANWL